MKPSAAWPIPSWRGLSNTMGKNQEDTDRGTHSIAETTAAILLLFFVFLLSVYLVYTYLPVHVDWTPNGPVQVGVDWKLSFYKACQQLLKGFSPYTGVTFYNPPWVLIPLLPIAFFPPALGSAIMFVVNFFAYIIVLIRFKVNKFLYLPFFLFSGMYLCLMNGNVDGLVALGFILPPPWGLFFVLAKPQIGASVAVFWAVEAWRQGGWRQLLRIFAPVLTAYILSFAIFGAWFNNISANKGMLHQALLWPYALPLGIFLTGMAIYKRDIKYAITASPFLSPYVGFPSWAVMVLGWFALLSQYFEARLSIAGLKNKFSRLGVTSRREERTPDGPQKGNGRRRVFQ